MTYNFGIYIQNSGININWFPITKTDTTVTAKSSVLINYESETLDAMAFNIYINPVENSLFFTGDVSGSSVKIVSSQTGALFSEQKISSNNIDVSSFPTGIYTIILEKEGVKKQNVLSRNKVTGLILKNDLVQFMFYLFSKKKQV